MALKRINEIKRVAGTDTLELTPDENEAIRIKRIEILTVTKADHINLSIGRTAVGEFIIGERAYNMFSLDPVTDFSNNFFDVLKERGIELLYPVAEGETFKLVAGQSQDYMWVIYDVYEAGDVSNEEINGSKAKEFMYCDYLTNKAEWDAGSWYTLDKSLISEEFPDFPVKLVPSNTTIELLGIADQPLACSVGDGAVTLGTSYTEFLRLFYQRQVLFDADKNGWLSVGNKAFAQTTTTKTYSYSNYLSKLPFYWDFCGKFFVLETPLEFKAGDELGVQIGGTIDPDVSIEADKLFTMLLLKAKYGE